MRTIIHDEGEPVVIRGFAYDYQAELARALLEAADIPALLIRESYEGLGMGPVRLAVRRGDVRDAIEVLDAVVDDDAAADAG